MIAGQYSCKKFEERPAPKQTLKSGSEQLTISFQDIYEALPQTVMLTLKDSFTFYFDAAEWKYTDSSLIIRIPTSQTKQNYIYAIKKYSSPEALLLYSVGIIPDQGSGRDTFSGKEIWLDYQDWHVYGIQFERNQPVQYLSPVEVAHTGWESCMMESGYFSLDESEHLVVHDVPLRGDGCPDANPGPTFFERIRNIINDIIDWLGSGGDSGGGGGSWGSDGSSYLGGPIIGVGIGAPGGGGGGGGGSEGGSTVPLTEVPSLGGTQGSDYADGNGYYHSRKTELNLHLTWNANALINCDSLEALEDFFPMWQDVASFEVPQSIIDRLENLSNTTNIDDDPRFEIQYLDSAAGPLINLDFFPVHINALPLINGQTITPGAFLEYFRGHINYFVSTGWNPAIFFPYQDNGINDSILWNQTGANAVSALVHIDLDNDGTVVLAENTITSPSHNHFTFSTVITPLDGYHPVSGNRRFGIYPDPVNGGYVFYTMGTDRISLSSFNFTNSIVSWLPNGPDGFYQADQLWQSLQSKMVSFVNNNNGSSAFYAPHYYTIRPPYEAIEAYLKKQITWFQLRQQLGCL